MLQNDRESFVSRSTGVTPLLELVAAFPSGLDGAVVIDMVVGLCAARIFCYLRAGRVVAKTMSKSAHQALTDSDIPHGYLNLVEEIRNQSNTAICPFESIGQKYTEPLALIRAMRALLGGIKNERDLSTTVPEN